MDKIKSYIKSISAYLEDFEARFRKWFFDFMQWFLADVAYTLLPIAVIASIKALTYNKGNYLYLSPEWSFATIVSLGTAITSLIELKTEIQQDFSHKIYSGTRLYILLLITSVIVLSLVVLRDDGLNINSTFLWVAQLALLFMSLASLYISHLAKRKQTLLETKFPSDMGRGRYFKILNRKLDRIQDEVTYLRFALKKHASVNFPAAMSFQDIQFWENTERNNLQQRFLQLEKNLTEINNLSKELINSSVPELVSNEMADGVQSEKISPSDKNA